MAKNGRSFIVWHTGAGQRADRIRVQIVFKDTAINYKQHLRITDDAGLTTGFDKVGSWAVSK
jgi:hypothetical protein